MRGVDKVNSIDILYNKSGKYPKKDLVGHTFGRLTVLSWKGRNKYRKNIWLCQCSCDNKVIVLQGHLKDGFTKSCGCLKSEYLTKHGYSRINKNEHPLYRKFVDMKQRCYNENNTHYKDYGGRGIKICKEWVNSPEVFIEWALKNGYKEGLSIERINNDEGYSSENCCFITLSEQYNNRRSNNLLTYNGKTQNITQWAKEVGINCYTLYSRIRYGWAIEDALFRPVATKQKKGDQHESIQ